MHPIDFLKITVCCGIIAWLAFNFPALSQGIIIAVLFTIWLMHLYGTVTKLRHR